MEGKMNKLFIGILIALAACQITQAREIRVDCKPQKVTVYKLGAHIEFEFEAKFDKGMNKVIIDSLPLAFDPSSFILSSDKKILISSLEYELNKQDLNTIESSKIITDIRDSMALLDKQIAKLNNKKLVLSGEEKIITSYSVNTQSNANASIKELKEHADYYFAKVSEIKEKLFDIENQIELINSKKKALEKEITDYKSKTDKQYYSMHANIRSDNIEYKKITFSCLTHNAGWIPSYDIRVKDTKSPFLLVFNAKIWQITGFDWDDVNITVSTRNPSVFSVYEEPKAWLVWNGYKSEIYSNSSNYFNDKYVGGSLDFYTYIRENNIELIEKNPQQEALKINVQRSRSGGGGWFSSGSSMDNPLMQESSYDDDDEDDIDYDDENEAIQKKNAIKMLTSGDQKVGVGAENYFSFVYSPTEKISIASGNKPAQVVLDEESVDCSYKHISQPKIASEAFLIANIVDWGKLRLLNGDANVYLENAYIGKSKIDVLTAKDTMLVFDRKSTGSSYGKNQNQGIY
jgi:hypothetical protein